MRDAGDEQWGRVSRRCPHCGARSQTLGTVCPRCGRSFAPRGLLDLIPFLSSDPTFPAYAAPLWALAAVALAAFVVILFVRNWQVATVVVAGLVVALVVAIGVANWAAQRRPRR